MIKITKFYFDKATYLVGSDAGGEVVLEIDYKNNQFRIVGNAGKARLMIESFAKDLLERKHAVNFAKKFELY